jgi:hypothetical protein
MTRDVIDIIFMVGASAAAVCLFALCVALVQL